MLNTIMTRPQAINIVGARARWELVAMKKALEMMPFFNSDKDEERLEAVNVLLMSDLFKMANREIDTMFETLSNGERLN